jgi:drug/metabolite transporter (DMT)-like permease
MNNTIKAHLALLVANFIYGANYTIAKGVMPDYIAPFGFILIRIVGATALFWIVGLFLKKEKLDPKDLLRLAICALFGVAMNQLLFFKGLNITTPINAGIMMTSNPILVLIAASLLLNEALTKNKIIGIILGLIGASILILFNGSMSFGSETLIGDLCVLLNSLSYGIYLVAVTPLMKKYQPLTVIKWVFLFGLIYVIPFGYSEVTQVNWQVMPSDIIWSVLFVVIFTTFFTYLLNIFALKNVSPTVASTYIYLQPFIAALFSLWLGKDSIDEVKIFSAILIFIGVYLVSKPAKKIANN